MHGKEFFKILYAIMQPNSSLLEEPKSGGSTIKNVDLVFSISKDARTESDLLPIIQTIKKSQLFPHFEKEPKVLAEIASKMDMKVCQAGIISVYCTCL